MDEPTRLAVEEAFKLALNASLGLESSSEHIAFVAEHLRAQADEKALPTIWSTAGRRRPGTARAGGDRTELVAKLLEGGKCEVIEAALAKALNRAANGSGAAVVLSRVANFLEDHDNEAPSSAEGIDAADWSKAYNKSFAAKNLSRSSTKEISSYLQQSKLQYSEDQRLAEINGYAVNKPLGKGAFGEVFMASRDGQHFAIKVLKRNKVKKLLGPPGRGPPGRGLGGGGGGGGGGSILDTVKTEIATLKKIAHPNCVQMHDVIYEATDDQVFLVLEYVDGGCSQRIGEDGKPIPLDERVIWSHTRHFLMGLEYLHMNGIVHRDIKPENLMVTKPGRLYAGDVTAAAHPPERPTLPPTPLPSLSLSLSRTLPHALSLTLRVCRRGCS